MKWVFENFGGSFIIVYVFFYESGNWCLTSLVHIIFFGSSGIGLMNSKFETIYRNFIVTICAYNLTALMHSIWCYVRWKSLSESLSNYISLDTVP